MEKQRRKLVPRDDRVTINHEFGSVEAFIQEYVSNISRSGVFIKTRDPLDVGTKVNLRFSIIMDDIETVEGVGEVVRVQTSPAGMGVVFISLTSHSQSLIAKLMTRRRPETLRGLGEAVEPARRTRGAKPPPVPADAGRGRQPKKRP